MTVRQEPMQEHPSMLILIAVSSHERQMGVGGLALVLKGSKSKRVLERGLHDSKVFGALLYHPVDVIENFIKQLIAQKYLRIVDVGQEYAIPVLELADAGKEALEDQLDIPLQPVRTPPILNESARITLQAFQKLRSVAAVAELRGLAENTVWDHLLIAVRLGLIASTDVVEPQKIKLILETNARLKPKGLKELKQSLPEDIGYDEIRCVLSDKP